jgi:hypothetical protein
MKIMDMDHLTAKAAMSQVDHMDKVVTTDHNDHMDEVHLAAKKPY